MPTTGKRGKGSPADESVRDLSTRGLNKDRGGQERGDGATRPKRVKPPARGIAGVPGSKNPERRCTAIVRSTGERCKRAAIKGGFVCTSHGGKAPQVQKKARERLTDLVDPFISELRRIVMESDADDSVKLRGIIALLDRTGYGPGSKLEVSGELSKFEQIQLDVYGIDIVDGKPVARVPHGGVKREEMEDDPRALPSSVGVGEPWEDLDQAQHDAQAEAWREYDIEDERPYSTRIESPGPVVRGEVVSNDPPDYSRSRR